MNITQNSDFIDEIMAELERCAVTEQAQMECISDICEKSNNILLQIESSRKPNSSQGDPSATHCKYCKDTLHALANIVEMFERIMNNSTTAHHPPGDFETYITSTKIKIDFLGNAVRKLLALNDTVNQIGSEIHVDSDYYEMDSTDTGDTNSSSE